jgi:hypothetical protein
MTPTSVEMQLPALLGAVRLAALVALPVVVVMAVEQPPLERETFVSHPSM